MLATLWRNYFVERASRSILARISPILDSKFEAVIARLEGRIAVDDTLMGRTQDSARRKMENLREGIEGIRSTIRPMSSQVIGNDLGDVVKLVLDRLEQIRPWEENFFVPNPGIVPSVDAPFMVYSTCSAADFRTSAFLALCSELAMPPRYHRKIWEWMFIIYHLRRLGAVGPNQRGMVFGVGTEPLPSLFARDGAEIVATDAPPEIGVAAGWGATQQYAAARDGIRHSGIIDRDTFDRRVTYTHCDMNNIGEEFKDFDFCWSSCCLEHLGSLAAGLDFVVNSVERTLKVGGVACHTTEINLSSDVDTVSTGDTVLYRRQDLGKLVDLLRARGHEVDEIKIAPDNNPLDFYIDVPPYRQNVHLKLQLFGYTSTSVGLVIRRGR